MGLFEFVLVMVSLILAIGVTQLLREMALIIRHKNALVLDWAPLVWFATLFLYALGYWWSLWDFREVQWTYPGYFFLVLSPTLLYVAISLLASTDVSIEGFSLQSSFESVRVPFLLTVAAFQLIGSWDGWLFAVEPVWNLLRATQVGLVLTCVAGTFSPSAKLQKIVSLSEFGLLVFAMFFLRFLPGAFGPN